MKAILLAYLAVFSQAQTLVQEEESRYYRGIGIYFTVEEDGSVVIRDVLERSPAEAAGIQPGFVLLEVNGQSVEGMSVDDIRELVLSTPDGHPARLRFVDGEVEIGLVTIDRVDWLPLGESLRITIPWRLDPNSDEDYELVLESLCTEDVVANTFTYVYRITNNSDKSILVDWGSIKEAMSRYMGTMPLEILVRLEPGQSRQVSLTMGDWPELDDISWLRLCVGSNEEVFWVEIYDGARLADYFVPYRAVFSPSF